MSRRRGMGRASLLCTVVTAAAAWASVKPAKDMALAEIMLCSVSGTTSTRTTRYMCAPPYLTTSIEDAGSAVRARSLAASARWRDRCSFTVSSEGSACLVVGENGGGAATSGAPGSACRVVGENGGGAATSGGAPAVAVHMGHSRSQTLTVLRRSSGVRGRVAALARGRASSCVRPASGRHVAATRVVVASFTAGALTGA